MLVPLRRRLHVIILVYRREKTRIISMRRPNPRELSTNEQASELTAPDEENPEWTEEDFAAAELGPPWPLDGVAGASLALRKAARALRTEAILLEDEADRLIAAGDRVSDDEAVVPEPTDA